MLNIPQLSWTLEPLVIEPLHSSHPAVPLHLKQKHYSISALHYWFVYHFLLAENSNNPSLQICEIEAGRGQQLDFIHSAVSKGCPGVSYERWDAVGADIDKGRLRGKGYHNLFKLDYGETCLLRDTGRYYDVIILILEPEKMPAAESIISGLLHNLKPNGILIGVYYRALKWEQGRKDNGFLQHGAHAHALEFRAGRLRRITRKQGLAIDFLSGGFFRRSYGLVSIRRTAWFRFNLLMGSVLPSLAGNIYGVFRK